MMQQAVNLNEDQLFVGHAMEQSSVKPTTQQLQQFLTSVLRILSLRVLFMHTFCQVATGSITLHSRRAFMKNSLHALNCLRTN